MRTTLATVFALILISSGMSSAAQPYNLTLAGASPSGLWTMLGVGIDRAVKASYPDSTITYQTSGGGLANVMLLDSGKVELGLVHDAELKIAQDGAKPFTRPIDSMHVLAFLYDWAPMQMIMTKSFANKYGIRTFDDIAARKPPLRVALNKRGNITEYVAMKMFEAIGVSLDDIKEWGGSVVYAGSSEQADLMKDHRIDMLANGVFLRTSFILQAADAVELTLLPVSEPVVRKVSQELGIQPFVVKAGSYSWQPQTVQTVAVGAALVASEKMDEQTAYNLTKALHQNIDQLQGVHNSMKVFTPELMVGYKGTYHKGAERYYREVGLMD